VCPKSGDMGDWGIGSTGGSMGYIDIYLISVGKVFITKFESLIRTMYQLKYGICVTSRVQERCQRVYRTI